MHPIVEEFLQKKQEEKRKKFEEEKAKTLMDLEICERVYADKTTYSIDFPYAEYDDSGNVINYYKKAPIEVTDEEYTEILKHTNNSTTVDSSIAIALRAIAFIIYLGGFIAGIVLGNVEVVKGTYYHYTDTEFSLAIAFVYWCAAFISGTMFLGFAEIIKLLNDIKNK